MISLVSLRRLVLAGCVIVLAPPGWSQPALSLQDAQRLALARSRTIDSLDAASQAVRELAVAAGRLPDPVLKLGVENVPLGGPDRFSLSRDSMTMRRIGVMQELPRADKRRLKVERVERDGQRIAAERAVAVANVQRETALAWIDRHYTQAVVDLLQRQLGEAQLQEQGAELAYRTGRGGQGDVFAAQVAIAGIRDKLAQAQRQLRATVVMLSRWVGPQAETMVTAGAADWRSSRADPLPGDITRLPRLQELAAQVAAAETELRQADANTRADWTVEAMYGQRGSGYPDMLTIGVSIPLQLDRPRRQDREVAAKRATLAQAEALYQEALVAQRAEVEVLSNDLEANRARLTRLTTDLLPAARHRTQAAETAYATAKGDLVGVLAARRDETESRMQVLSLELETARLWAQLNYLEPAPAILPSAKEQP